MIRKIGFLVSALALAGSVALTSPPLVIISLFGMLMFAFGTPASAMSEEEKAAVKWPSEAPHGFLLADEEVYGYTGANDD